MPDRLTALVRRNPRTTPGYPANLPDQPVIRIAWQEAIDYCRWLSGQTGS